MRHKISYNTSKIRYLNEEKIYDTVYKNKTQRVVKVNLSANTQIFQTYDSTLVNTVLYSK